MTLLGVPEPFDHPDWLFELKLDGFRALAYIEGHHCRLFSRRGHVFKSWPYLNVNSHTRSSVDAVLDRERITCLGSRRTQSIQPPAVST
jgi:bifunctional non-homologous end joining protein LigD